MCVCVCGGGGALIWLPPTGCCDQRRTKSTVHTLVAHSLSKIANLNMYLKLSLLLVFCLATLQPLRAQTDNRTEIHVAFITSFGGEYDSSGVIPAVQLATELINNRTDLLTGHELVIELIEDRNTSFQYANSNVSHTCLLALHTN